MATTNSLKETMTTAPQQNGGRITAKALLNAPAVKSKFEEVLKDKASGFVSSVLTLVNNDKYLANADPNTVMAGAMIAATLDLPLDKNLGYAYLVPFSGKANFIIGYKGYIQLAQRSGKYKSLNVIPVYKGELVRWNRLTEEIEFDPSKKEDDTVIGYVGYFKLINGFEKTVYWSKEEVEVHRIRHNKLKNPQELNGVWKTDYNTMACKTVLRNMLSKWGLLSIEMQKAEINDEKTVEVDVETGEIKTAEPVEETEYIDNEESAHQEMNLLSELDAE